jgi:hypothetical protein
MHPEKDNNAEDEEDEDDLDDEEPHKDDQGDKVGSPFFPEYRAAKDVIILYFAPE